MVWCRTLYPWEKKSNLYFTCLGISKYQDDTTKKFFPCDVCVFNNAILLLLVSLLQYTVASTQVWWCTFVTYLLSIIRHSLRWRLWTPKRTLSPLLLLFINIVIICTCSLYSTVTQPFLYNLEWLITVLCICSEFYGKAINMDWKSNVFKGKKLKCFNS